MSLRILAAALTMLAVGVGMAASAGAGPQGKAAKAPAADVRTTEWACPQEPWPFGCQWRDPIRRVTRTPRPS